MFKKYEVANNVMAQLDWDINTTQTIITIKNQKNIPQVWNWILTAVKFDENWNTVKNELMLVKSVNWKTLEVERWFDNTSALNFTKNDFIFLNITSQIIKDIQEEIENKANKKEIPNISNFALKTETQRLQISIENIRQLLTSDDTDLDTIQEIVNFIKINKTALNSLTIDAISGLRNKLNELENRNINTDNLAKLNWWNIFNWNQEIKDIISFQNFTWNVNTWVARLGQVKDRVNGSLTIQLWNNWQKGQKFEIVDSKWENILFHVLDTWEVVINWQNITWVWQDFSPTFYISQMAWVQIITAKYKIIGKTAFVSIQFKWILSWDCQEFWFDGLPFSWKNTPAPSGWIYNSGTWWQGIIMTTTHPRQNWAKLITSTSVKNWSSYDIWISIFWEII